MEGFTALRIRPNTPRTDLFRPTSFGHRQDTSPMQIDEPGEPSRKRRFGSPGPSPFVTSSWGQQYQNPQFQQHNQHPGNTFLFNPPPSLPQLSPAPPFPRPIDVHFSQGTTYPQFPSSGYTSHNENGYGASYPAGDVDMDGTPVKEEDKYGSDPSTGLDSMQGMAVVDHAHTPSKTSADDASPLARAKSRIPDQLQAGPRATVEDAEEEEEPARPIAKGAVSRAKRRRELGWKRRYETDTEGEEEPERRVGQSLKTEHTYHHHHNLSAPAMRHSEVPALLLGYLQFFVNASIVVFVLYLAGLFVLTVKRDVSDRMAEASIELLQEISECSHLYLTNRCDPAVRVPAMEAACKAWDICMHRDPTMIGRTNVMAETFAGVINAFVEQISWKTMGFTLVTLSFMVTLANSALFNLRQSASHPNPPHSAPFYPQGLDQHQHNLSWHPYQQPAGLGAGMGHQGMLGTGQSPVFGDRQEERMSIKQIGWDGGSKKREVKAKGWLW